MPNGSTQAKQIIKELLFHIFPKEEGFSSLRVLQGPARGTVLRLDLRVEGSYWIGTYDKWVFDSFPLETLIGPGAVVWDCGAYVGYYSACFRRIVGSLGEIHAFEASPTNFGRLRHLPLLNGWSNVFVHHLAVGPHHTTLDFVDNLGGSSGPFGLGKTYADDAALTLSRVVSTGVDELVYERGFRAPDMIKFDLESAEEYALHNGERVFEDKRPVILLEIHGDRAKVAAGAFLERYRYEAVRAGGVSATEGRLRSCADMNRIGGDWHMMLARPV